MAPVGMTGPICGGGDGGGDGEQDDDVRHRGPLLAALTYGRHNYIRP